MRGHVLLGDEHLLAEWAVDILGADVLDLDVVVADLLVSAPEEWTVIYIVLLLIRYFVSFQFICQKKLK